MSAPTPIDPRQIDADDVLIEKVRSGDDVAPLLSAVRDNARRPS